MKFFYISLFLIFFISISWSNSSHNLNYSIPESGFKTLRSGSFDSRVWRHNQIVNKNSSLKGWTYSCNDFDSLNAACAQDDALLQVYREDSNAMVQVKPLVGIEYRQLDSFDDKVLAIDGGINLKSYIGNLSMYLDARIFTEKHSASDYYFYDREFIEVQEEDEFSDAEYISYARYKASISYDGDYGSIGFKRDAIHWGPGVYNNLVMNGDAVPYPTFYYKGEVGPVRIMGIWSSLAIDSGLAITETRGSNETRFLYGHRYEWNITPNLLVGMTEQLIVYDGSAPAAIIPIVPLFMDKGQGYESNNNGNMSFDLAYRFPKWIMLYGEFMIDDIQDPKQLFSNHKENIWGAMLGFHGTYNFNDLQSGLVFEYARVEPWAYTHYRANTVQSANRNYPLGNQSGPDSRTIISNLYLRDDFNWNVGVKMKWLWKGTDPGSHVNDPINETRSKYKTFLNGIDSPFFTISPQASYTWKWVTLDIFAEVDEDWNMDFVSRIHLSF